MTYPITSPQALTEAEDNEKSASRWEGFFKVAFTLISPTVASAASFLTLAGLACSAVTAAAESIAPKGEIKDTLHYLNKRSRSFTANSFFVALTYATVIIPLVEGVANMYSEKRDFGFGAISRYAAEGFSGKWFGEKGIPQTELEEFKIKRAAALEKEKTVDKATHEPKKTKAKVPTHKYRIKPKLVKVTTSKAPAEKSSARDKLTAQREQAASRPRSKSF